MIKINKYDATVENDYLEIVEKHVKESVRKKIVKGFRTYFTCNAIPNSDSELEAFRKLILADYSTLHQLYKSISLSGMKSELETPKGRRKKLYRDYYKKYDTLIKKSIGADKVNVYLIKNSKTYTCPYCNRNYISVRGKNAGGAQLDHFFNRIEFPVFALCLYNLIPCCNTCNLLKQKEKDVVSPFDSNLNDKSVIFKKKGSALGGDLAVEVKEVDPKMKKNIDILRLNEAYEIHSEDLKEILELVEIYPKSQEEELCEVINKTRQEVGKRELTGNDIKNMVFGKQLLYEEYGKRPLSKFRHDILKELHIFE